MSAQISFESTNDFSLQHPVVYKNWIEKVAVFHDKEIGDILYVFCDDSYLLEINQQYLNHNTYTDIITFDDSQANLLFSEIYISTQRVQENASHFSCDFEEELKRVMIHGILHCIGFKDSTDEEKAEMRAEEERMMKLFHVEH